MITTTKQYLEQIAGWLHESKRNINNYSCFEDFVLKNGMQFHEKGRLPKNCTFRAKKQCFANAARLVQFHPNLVYVEGFANSGVIPMLHAWCVTRDGKILDPTWDDGSDYFGVPIKYGYMLQSMIQYGVYGLIDNWKERWPMLRASPKEFLETKVKPNYDNPGIIRETIKQDGRRRKEVEKQQS